VEEILQEADLNNQPAAVVEANKTLKGRAGRVLGGSACVVVIEAEAVAVRVPITTRGSSPEDPHSLLLDPLPNTDRPIALIGEIAAAHATVALLNQH
jgi:hypothetical protein